jgi:hypothetical protein
VALVCGDECGVCEIFKPLRDALSNQHKMDRKRKRKTVGKKV